MYPGRKKVQVGTMMGEYGVVKACGFQPGAIHPPGHQRSTDPLLATQNVWHDYILCASEQAWYAAAGGTMHHLPHTFDENVAKKIVPHLAGRTKNDGSKNKDSKNLVNFFG